MKTILVFIFLLFGIFIIYYRFIVVEIPKDRFERLSFDIQISNCKKAQDFFEDALNNNGKIFLLDEKIIYYQLAVCFEQAAKEAIMIEIRERS